MPRSTNILHPRRVLQLRKGQSSEPLFKDDADRGANDGVRPSLTAKTR
jgi:hypothetical protein